MTGIIIRIKKDDKWKNVEFDQMTDQEMGEFVREKIANNPGDPHEGWNWAMTLAKWIRDNIKEQP